MNYYVGIDLGGTNIKMGLVDQDAKIVAENSRKTNLPRSAESVCDDMAAMVEEMLQKAGIPREQVKAAGVGSPGTANGATGMVEYSNNLGWRNFPLRDYLQARIELPVSIGNDANVAALGEVYAGSAKGAKSAVIITLGTGVGSGIVLDSHILTGHNAGAGEFGHMVVQHGGRLCTCGRKGCLEAYASATGLVQMTKDAIAAHPESLMAEVANTTGVDGRTAFNMMRKDDAAATQVVNDYISYLACGIANIINALQPEIISLGGGVAKEGDPLLVPLREQVYAETFGGQGEESTRIELCTLGYKAGIIGAAMLAAQG